MPPKHRLLVVGLAPGKNAVGLEPWIHTQSGRRLERMLGLGDVCGDCCDLTLLDWVDADNLVLDRPSGPRGVQERRRCGRRVLDDHDNDVIVAAGWTVAKALGCHSDRWFAWHDCRLRDDSIRRIGLMPHPSGASTFWNDPEDRAFAGRWFANAVYLQGWKHADRAH